MISSVSVGATSGFWDEDEGMEEEAEALESGRAESTVSSSSFRFFFGRSEGVFDEGDGRSVSTFFDEDGGDTGSSTSSSAAAESPSPELELPDSDSESCRSLALGFAEDEVPAAAVVAEE